MDGTANVAEALLTAGQDEAIAVFDRDDVVTYRELRARVAALAARLLADGHRNGERLGLFAENSAFFVTAYLAAIRAGMCVVPFQLQVNESTFAHIVGSTGMVTVLVSSRQRLRIEDWAASMGTELLEEAALASTADPGRTAPTEVEPARDLASIVFTSGSAGDSKGVMVTHRNIAVNTADIVDYLGLRANDRVMVVLPFYHCYGASLLHTHLAAGASIVINNQFMFPETVLDDLEARECTGFAGVPSSYQILLRKTRFKERSFPRLRWLQQAGGGLPNSVIQELLAAHPGVELFIMYGQTEATARLSYLPPKRLDDKLGSIGMGLPHARLEVLRADGKAVEAGSDEVGEIVASGDNVTAGYWNDPEKTSQHFRAGRLHTGDLARIDDEGFIFIVDRSRDFIKSMGHRVSAKEIEDVIAELPDIVEVAVIGVPHELRGEAIVAFVVAVGTGFEGDAVRKHCLKRLPNFKVPTRVEIRGALPKTGASKVDKMALRAEGVS